MNVYVKIFNINFLRYKFDRAIKTDYNNYQQSKILVLWKGKCFSAKSFHKINLTFLMQKV
jgi:hypothetical protein